MCFLPTVLLGALLSIQPDLYRSAMINDTIAHVQGCEGTSIGTAVQPGWFEPRVEPSPLVSTPGLWNEPGLLPYQLLDGSPALVDPLLPMIGYDVRDIENGFVKY